MTLGLLAVIVSELIKSTHQTIAGVTYQDNFDFEERYENIHECDPLYWHPLHMPEHCAKMYEKIIRTKISKLRPVHDKEAKRQPLVYDLSPTIEYTYKNKNLRRNSHRSYEKNSKSKSRSKRRRLNSSSKKRRYKNEKYEESSMPDYETMLNLLKADVMREPSQPKIGFMPNLGIVAFYEQPVSIMSEQVIKEVSKAYARTVVEAYKNVPATQNKESKTPKTYKNFGSYISDPDTLTHYQIKLYPGIEGLPGIPQDNINTKENIKTKMELAKKFQSEIKTSSKNKNGKQRKKIKHGNLVAIFENT